MAILEVNTYALKGTARNNLESVKGGLESARNAAGSLLIPEDFRFCNYLLTEFYDDINDLINQYYQLKNWVENSINAFDSIGEEFADKTSSLQNINVKSHSIDIRN